MSKLLGIFAGQFNCTLVQRGTVQVGPRNGLSLDGIPDDELDEGIDENGGADSSDDEEILVSLQPTPERII